MIKRLLLIALFAYGCMTVMQAKCYESLNLKNGLTVEGNIISQKPGKTVTFSIERAYISVNSDWIDRTRERTVEKSELDEVWMRFLEEVESAPQGADYTFSDIRVLEQKQLKNLSPKDSSKVAMLTKIYNGRSLSSMILEDGAIVKFVSATSFPIDHTFKISEIHSIRYKEQDPLAVNGIEDEVETNNNGTIKGYIIEKTLGKGLRIKTVDGKIVNIFNTNIVSQRKNRLNKALSICKQVPYLDEITLKSSTDVHQGVISFQKSNKTESYLLLTDESNEEHRFEAKDIVEISRIRNDEYQPLTDFVIDSDSIYINRHAVKAMTIKENRKGLYILGEDLIGDVLVLHKDDVGRTINIEMKDNEINRSFIMSPITKVESEVHKEYSYKMEHILYDYIMPTSLSVSRSNNLCMTYEVKKGAYILFNRKNQTSYFCIIE